MLNFVSTTLQGDKDRATYRRNIIHSNGDVLLLVNCIKSKTGPRTAGRELTIRNPKVSNRQSPDDGTGEFPPL
jgi:hypothetical protein